MKESFKKTLEVGAVLNGKWEILEFISRGGQGEVYRGKDLNLSRDVAIKVISHAWIKAISGNPHEAENCIERYRREFQTMADIRHPNLVQIFDYGSMSISRPGKDDSIEYVVMEYIKGSTLRSTMADFGFYPNEDRAKEWLADYFLPVLDAVQALHRLGIIHRDLKPENILLDGKVPKIADLWLARFQSLNPITKTFELKGTPFYMSPEHFFDLKRIDERTDVYALGKILYEAVSGQRVHHDMPFETARLKSAETPFFQRLNRIIQDATSEPRELRLPSVEALKDAIEEACSDSVKAPMRHSNPPPRGFKNLVLKLWRWKQHSS
jgi:serine/threonine protein kinase